jgi:hypothetical protein
VRRGCPFQSVAGRIRIPSSGFPAGVHRCDCRILS